MFLKKEEIFMQPKVMFPRSQKCRMLKQNLKYDIEALTLLCGNVGKVKEKSVELYKSNKR
jgi:hypothetical protein